MKENSPDMRRGDLAPLYVEIALYDHDIIADATRFDETAGIAVVWTILMRPLVETVPVDPGIRLARRMLMHVAR